MDWRAFILLLWIVKISYGQNTCKRNPSDGKCYCVLDAAKNTDNWHEAVSFCYDVNGILVDINSQNTDNFVRSLMNEASVSDAWVGVKGTSSSATLISDLSTGISYPPTWNSPLDSTKMCASITNTGNWDGVQCSGGGFKSTICRMPPIDSSGYNIDTGCPLNGFLYGSKCYQTLTWTAGQTFDTDVCDTKSPGGKLIMPMNESEYQFILKVGKLSGFTKFWIRVEYGLSQPHFWYWGRVTFDEHITYGMTELTALLPIDPNFRPLTRFVINVDGTWGKELTLGGTAFGIMCEFDIGTPGAAEPHVCPVPSVISTTATPTTVPTAAVSTTVPTAAVTTTVPTAAVPTTVPTTVTTAAVPTTVTTAAVYSTPIASEETTSFQGFYNPEFMICSCYSY